MWLVLILIIIAVIVVCGIVSMKRSEQVAQQQHIEQVRQTQVLNTEYKNALHKLKSVTNEGEMIENLPIITFVTIEHKSNINNPSYYLKYSQMHYVWIKDEILYLFPTFNNIIFENSVGGRSECGISSSDWTLKSVPIDKIMFYRQIGTVYTTTTGSGGESSFSPITGFHGKINPIKIESQVHDERTTQLFYDDGTKDQIMIFQDKDYYVLRKLLPQKDYQVVTLSEANNNQAEDEFQRLEKLNKIHNSGLISDEDYQKKKEEILNNI